MSNDKSGMTHVKTSLPESVHDELEERLEYGDTKSGWIREAVKMRLDGDAADDGSHDQSEQ
jgi:metal-responsive CopG/Arc/MetJ family transcriptional regulator